MEKELQDAGIRMSTVAADILGVSGWAMLTALIAGERDAQVHRRDPAAAWAACAGCAELMAKVMVTELVRRGVLPPPGRPTVVF